MSLGLSRGGLRALFRGSPYGPATVFVLGIAVGVSFVVFHLADKTLLQPIPGVPSDRRLASVEFQQGESGIAVSFPYYEQIQRPGRSFPGLGGETVSPVILSGEGLSSRRLDCSFVTSNFFSVLGIDHLFAGVEFSAMKGSLAGRQESPVVISHRLWRDLFHADTRLDSLAIYLNGRAVHVIGVSPPRFKGTSFSSETDIWAPIEQLSALLPYMRQSSLEDPDQGIFFQLVGTLREGVSVSEASVEMTSLASVLSGYSWFDRADGEIRAVVSDDLGRPPWLKGQLKSVLSVILFASLLMVAIAAVNAAGLLLSHQRGRERDLSVKQALGATPTALTAEALTASVALALMAGGLGALIFLAVSRLLPAVRVIDDFPPISLLDWSWRTVQAVLLLCLILGVLVSAGPVWAAWRNDPMTGLRAGAAGRLWTSRVRNWLVVFQLGASLFLIFASLLFVKSLGKLESIDLGFDTQQTVTATLDPYLIGYRQPELAKLYEGLARKLALDTSIESFSFAEVAPLSGSIRSIVVSSEAEDGEKKPQRVWRNLVSPGYFDTLGIRLLAGRDFDHADTLVASHDSPQLAVLTKAVADTLWPQGDAVGRLFTIQGGKQSLQVIGVVEDHRTLELHRKSPLVYMPLREGTLPGSVSVVLRTAKDPVQLNRFLDSALLDLDSKLVFTRVRSLRESHQQLFSKLSLLVRVVGLLTVAGLVIAAVGLFGVVSGRVRSRRLEMAVRMALGENVGTIQARELRRAGMFFLKAVVVATAAGILLGGVLKGSLGSNVSPLDAEALLGAGLILAATVFLAALKPVIGVRKIDPAAALRRE